MYPLAERVSDLVIKDDGAVIIRQELVSPGHRIVIRDGLGGRSQRPGRVRVENLGQDVAIAIVIITDGDVPVFHGIKLTLAVLRLAICHILVMVPV